MDVLFLLIPLSVFAALVGVVACLIAIKKGQYDHLEENKWKILMEPEEISKKQKAQG